jgi:hypothetical protein
MKSYLLHKGQNFMMIHDLDIIFGVIHISEVVKLGKIMSVNVPFLTLFKIIYAEYLILVYHLFWEHFV